LNRFTPGTLSGLAGLATGEAIDPCEGNAPCWPPTGAPDAEYPSYNNFNSLGFKVMLLELFLSAVCIPGKIIGWARQVCFDQHTG